MNILALAGTTSVLVEPNWPNLIIAIHLPLSFLGSHALCLLCRVVINMTALLVSGPSLPLWSFHNSYVIVSLASAGSLRSASRPPTPLIFSSTKSIKSHIFAQLYISIRSFLLSSALLSGPNPGAHISPTWVTALVSKRGTGWCLLRRKEVHVGGGGRNATYDDAGQASEVAAP